MPEPTVAPPDYYRVLGVPYQATQTEIQRAYRAAMKRTHPDRLAPEHREEAAARARILNEAYRVLSKPERKQRYDAELKASLLQEQIMGRYAGGLVAPGNDADAFERMRAAQRAEQQRLQQRRSDREATTSLLVVFVGFALVILVLVLVGSALFSVLDRLI